VALDHGVGFLDEARALRDADFQAALVGSSSIACRLRLAMRSCLSGMENSFAGSNQRSRQIDPGLFMQ
jgi:hypothetical protein